MADELVEPVERLVERRRPPPVHQVEVEPVGCEAPEAALAGPHRGVSPGIGRKDLAHQEHLVPPPAYRFTHQLLGVAVAVHLGGVDEG